MDYGGDEMNCQFDEMLLYEYLDQLLEKDELLTVERHLSACPSCRKKLAEIKLLYYELDNLDDIQVPDEVDSIRASIVESAFSDEKVTTVERLRRTKKVLEETPVIGALVPTKEKLKGSVVLAAKGLYKGSKKVYQGIPEKKKKKKIRKSLGGLL